MLDLQRPPTGKSEPSFERILLTRDASRPAVSLGTKSFEDAIKGASETRKDWKIGSEVGVLKTTGDEYLAISMLWHNGTVTKKNFWGEYKTTAVERPGLLATKTPVTAKLQPSDPNWDKSADPIPGYTFLNGTNVPSPKDLVAVVGKKQTVDLRPAHAGAGADPVVSKTPRNKFLGIF
jgi:hypothetical protein